MKSNLVGAELFPTDGRTDMTKLIVAFLNFASAPKKKHRNVKECRRAGSKRRKTGSSCRKLDDLYKAYILH